VVAQADHGLLRVRLGGEQLGNAYGQFLRAARIVHVGRGDVLHPSVHVEDRADAGVGLVDHPVLDRVHGNAPRLDVRRDAEHDAAVVMVVVRDQQDVAAGRLQRRFVDTARAHPEALHVLSLGEVAVGEAADPVQALDVPELALVEQVLDRKR
jgi:hypothetical protein